MNDETAMEMDRRLAAVERYQERMAREMNLLQQHQSASDQILQGMQQNQRDMIDQQGRVWQEISKLQDAKAEMLIAQAVTKTRLGIIIAIVVAVATGAGGVLSAIIQTKFGL